MQHKTLGAAGLAKYHEYVQSDHDFRLRAEVLTLEEVPVNEVPLLDGQVNFVTGDGPQRTATVTLSDPERALSFGADVADDPDGTLWVNRLLRVQHMVDVPDIGTVTSTPFIGVPTAAARSGGEVNLEMADKSLLADHGVLERSFAKGANAAATVHWIMYHLTGERKLRIPAHPRRLSQAYAVGMASETTTPWRVAKWIAWKELGWLLSYTCDGWCVAEPRAAAADSMPVKEILEFPDTGVEFNSVNYVRVTSGKWKSIAQLPDTHELSSWSLRRNGVRRYLPLVVDDTALSSAAQVNTRAVQTLQANSGLAMTQTYSTIPFFHLDNRDVLVLPEVGPVAFEEGSIPLGTGGNMTLGRNAWVSNPVIVRKVTHRG